MLRIHMQVQGGRLSQRAIYYHQFAVCANIHASVIGIFPDPVFLSYGNMTLAGSLSYLLDWLQSVMNSVTQLVFTLSRYNHITPLLHPLLGSKPQSQLLTTSW